MEDIYGYEYVLRNIDSVRRDIGRCSLRLFYEKGSEPVGAEVPDRFCGRCYGSCICVESSDSAIEQSGNGKLSFIPAAAGFWAGVLFLLLLDHIIPHLHQQTDKAEGPKSNLQRTTMLVLAVTLHNIPEGMAVGVVYAGYLTGNAQITLMGALALSLGIAIQNFPEGAIISLPASF